MNAANKCKTTAWASGRTWCAAQVVIIDGITAWKVYNVKFSKKEILEIEKGWERL